MVWCINRIRNTADTAASRSGFQVHPSGCANDWCVVLKPDWYQSRGATVQAFGLRKNSAFCGRASTSHQGAVLTHRKYDLSSHPFWVVWKLLYSWAPNGFLLTSGFSETEVFRMQFITWLILPVVICLSQRLSHACLSISFTTAKLRMAH